MATYTKFQPFVEQIAEGTHNLATGTLIVALTNAAPTNTWAILGSVTEITYTNLSSRVLTTSSSSQTGGTYSLVIADWIGTASGGSVGPFRYAVIYNDTPTGDPLIAYYDYGSSITLLDGETLTLDFAAGGLFTIV